MKLILDGYVTPEELPDILDRCMLRTQEERALIADLLELGHLEVIETFKMVNVQVDQILRDVVAACQGQIDQKNLQFDFPLH